MIRNPLFLAYGGLVMLFSGYAGYTGMGFNKVNEQKVVPKTVRDNPGAYRSHYYGYPRYIGGK